MRRAAFLLVSTTSDGRIARYFREKSDVLSLKMSKSATASHPFFFPMFFASFHKGEDGHC